MFIKVSALLGLLITAAFVSANPISPFKCIPGTRFGRCNNCICTKNGEIACTNVFWPHNTARHKGIAVRVAPPTLPSGRTNPRHLVTSLRNEKIPDFWESSSLQLNSGKSSSHYLLLSPSVSMYDYMAGPVPERRAQEVSKRTRQYPH
ncbi:hypothetical protein C8J57DRAFT_1229485 [Mycena rebaudengoi]|nr:hypothetical protein C8J57DRAFT_1229485 [Mycena rebaudengoi]